MDHIFGARSLENTRQSSTKEKLSNLQQGVTQLVAYKCTLQQNYVHFIPICIIHCTHFTECYFHCVCDSECSIIIVYLTTIYYSEHLNTEIAGYFHRVCDSKCSVIIVYLTTIYYSEHLNTEIAGKIQLFTHSHGCELHYFRVKRCFATCTQSRHVWTKCVSRNWTHTLHININM